MVDHRTLWQQAHAASVLFSVLLFTAGFVCVLLWTNDIVHTATGLSSLSTSTFTYYSPTVSTFTITFNVAIFGTVFNSIMYVVLVVLGRDTLPISSRHFRYDLEKAACTVSAVGNAIYSAACIALMATLAQLAANANTAPPKDFDLTMADELKASTVDRRAGEGSSAAMAGLAAAAAIWACLMDAQHMKYSSHRHGVKSALLGEGGKPLDDEEAKQE